MKLKNREEDAILLGPFKYPTENDQKRWKTIQISHRILALWKTIESFRSSGNVYRRVRGPCLLTGKFKGATHNSWNINAKQPNFVSAVFHNLNTYNIHLFFEKLVNKKTEFLNLM